MDYYYGEVVSISRCFLGYPFIVISTRTGELVGFYKTWYNLFSRIEIGDYIGFRGLFDGYDGDILVVTKVMFNDYDE